MVVLLLVIWQSNVAIHDAITRRRLSVAIVVLVFDAVILLVVLAEFVAFVVLVVVMVVIMIYERFQSH